MTPYRPIAFSTYLTPLIAAPHEEDEPGEVVLLSLGQGLGHGFGFHINHGWFDRVGVDVGCRSVE